jgi:hypothetical protein
MMTFSVTGPVRPLPARQSAGSLLPQNIQLADRFERSSLALRRFPSPAQHSSDDVLFGGKRLKKALIRTGIGLGGALLVVGGSAAFALVPTDVFGKGYANAVTVNRALAGACQYGADLHNQDVYKDGVFAPYSPETQLEIVQHALRDVGNATFLTLPAAQSGFEIKIGYVPPKEGKPVVVFRPGADQRVDDDRPLLLEFIRQGYGVLTYVDPVQNEQGKKVYQQYSAEESFTDNFLRVAHWLASPSSFSASYISGQQVQPVSISNQIWGGRSIGGAVVVNAAARLEQAEESQKPKEIFMINTPASLGAFAQGWTDNEAYAWFRWAIHQVCGGNVSEAIEMLGHDFNVEMTLPLIKSIPVTLIKGAEEHSGTGDTVEFVRDRGLSVRIHILPSGTHDNATNSFTEYATRGENLAPDVDGKNNPNAAAVADWVIQDLN